MVYIFASSLPNILSKERYPGSYDFEVEVNNDHNSNNGYMVSKLYSFQ